jgi:hypothetical protein
MFFFESKPGESFPTFSISKQSVARRQISRLAVQSDRYNDRWTHASYLSCYEDEMGVFYAKLQSRRTLFLVLLGECPCDCYGFQNQ